MPADKSKAFGLRLRELREKAALTQGQLARKAGLSLPGITKLELGARQPSLPTLLALARALGLDVNALAAPPESEVAKRGRGRPAKGEAAGAPPAAPKPARKPKGK
jgi:transcriptional regulator with XRE-family HTH domain